MKEKKYFIVMIDNCCFRFELPLHSVSWYVSEKKLQNKYFQDFFSKLYIYLHLIDKVPPVVTVEHSVKWRRLDKALTCLLIYTLSFFLPWCVHDVSSGPHSSLSSLLLAS